MPRNFSSRIHYDKQTVLAVILPYYKADGLYYEINISGLPRFHMTWSPLGRFDITEHMPGIPDSLILAISDVLEKEKK
jgi:hypothetical protein